MVAEDSLAYLALRPAPAAADGSERYEVGVTGPGPAGDTLAGHVADEIRLWNSQFRNRTVRFALPDQPSGSDRTGAGSSFLRSTRSRWAIVVEGQRMRMVSGLATLAEPIKLVEKVDITLHVQSRVGGGLAVTVRGDLDYVTSERFLTCIDTTLRPPPTVLYVDLHLVTFLDSSGIGALVTARKRTERAGTQLILERPTPAVYRTLETAGLVDFLRLTRP